MMFKDRTGIASQKSARTFGCEGGAGVLRAVVGRAPGPRNGRAGCPLTLPTALGTVPRPWGSGPFSHLTVCAEDRAPLFSETLEGPRLCLPPCAPQSQPTGLCSGSSPAWNPHSSRRALLTPTAASLRGLPPPWGPERGCRGQVGGHWAQDRVSRPSPGVDLGTPGPSRHPEPCSAQGGSMTEGGQAQAPHGAPPPPVASDQS